MKLTTVLTRLAAHADAQPSKHRLLASRPAWDVNCTFIEIDSATGRLWLWRGDEGQIMQYAPNVRDIQSSDWQLRPVLRGATR